MNFILDKNRTRKSLLVVALMTVFSLSFFALDFNSAALAAETVLLEKKAALVNNKVIAMADFQMELERVKRQKGKALKGNEEAGLSALKREALENLITRELLFQEGVRQNIVINQSQVEREMVEVKARFATTEAFTAGLERMKMDEAMVFRQIGRGLAIRETISQAVTKKIAVTDDEIKAYYEGHLADFTRPPQFHISHILVSIGKDRKAASDKINAIQKRLSAGEKFAVLASEVSDCNSKQYGGSLGWFADEQVTPAVAKAIKNLNAGDLTGVVEDKFGFHLIRMNERKDSVVLPLKEVREKVTNLVKQEKGLAVLQRYVAGLRDKARVEILLSEND